MKSVFLHNGYCFPSTFICCQYPRRLARWKSDLHLLEVFQKHSVLSLVSHLPKPLNAVRFQNPQPSFPCFVHRVLVFCYTLGANLTFFIILQQPAEAKLSKSLPEDCFIWSSVAIAEGSQILLFSPALQLPSFVSHLFLHRILSCRSVRVPVIRWQPMQGENFFVSNGILSFILLGGYYFEHSEVSRVGQLVRRRRT